MFNTSTALPLGRFVPAHTHALLLVLLLLLQGVL
jgi:hypothetical protein